MEIVICDKNLFFDNKLGIEIDDAYDTYKRYNYIKYVKENSVDMVYSRDYDISYLIDMPTIKYVILNDDIYNYEVLYEMPNLIGIKIFASSLKKLDINKMKFLKYIAVIVDEDISLLKYCHLEALELINCNKIPDFMSFNKLVRLSLVNCNIISIGEIPNTIQFVNLDYCLKLRDISGLFKSKNLKILHIYDCNNIVNVCDIIKSCDNLEKLYLYNKTLKPKNRFDSLNFLKKLYNLTVFRTDYKVDDNDLKPLLNLKDANLYKWYKKYNLKDSQLPHEFVLYSNNGIVEQRKFSDIAEEEKNNIIWLDSIS